METKIRELIRRFEADYKQRRFEADRKQFDTVTATYMVGEIELQDKTKAQVQIIITTDKQEFLNEIPV